MATKKAATETKTAVKKLPTSTVKAPRKVAVKKPAVAQNISQEYLEGAVAFREGRMQDQCPHPLGSNESQEWAKGWHTASTK